MMTECRDSTRKKLAGNQPESTPSAWALKSTVPKLFQLVRLSALLCICFGLAGIRVPISRAQDCSAEVQVEFSRPVHVHNSLPSFTNGPTIAAAGSNVYLTWFDWADGTWIRFSRSPDRGKTFTAPVILSGQLSASHSPQIAASGNHVYVVWSDGPFWGGIGWVYFAFSADEGKTFSPPIRLSMSNGASIPYIAAVENNVYVVWGELICDGGELICDYRPRVLMTLSRNSGTTFSPHAIISGSLYGWPGGIAALDNRVHVLFNGAPAVGGPTGDVYSTVSTDSGNTFREPINVSNSPDLSTSEMKLAVTGGNVYAVWTDIREAYPRNVNVYFAGSTDAGETFSRPVNISNSPSTGSEPCLAASGSDVYIGWLDTRQITGQEHHQTFYSHIFFSRSADAGATFSEPLDASEPLEVSQPKDRPSPMSNSCRLAASGDNVYLLWASYLFEPAGLDVYLISSADNGKTFSEIRNLSSHGADADANLVAFGGNVYITWARSTAECRKGREDEVTGPCDIFLMAGQQPTPRRCKSADSEPPRLRPGQRYPL